MTPKCTAPRQAKQSGKRCTSLCSQLKTLTLIDLGTLRSSLKVTFSSLKQKLDHEALRKIIIISKSIIIIFFKLSFPPLACLHFWISRKLLQEFKSSERDNPHSGINCNQSELMAWEVVPCQRGEKGMIALLNITLPHGQMDGRYKKDGWKDGYFPPRRLSCNHPNGLLWVSPTHS